MKVEDYDLAPMVSRACELIEDLAIYEGAIKPSDLSHVEQVVVRCYKRGQGRAERRKDAEREK